MLGSPSRAGSGLVPSGALGDGGGRGPRAGEVGPKETEQRRPDTSVAIDRRHQRHPTGEPTRQGEHRRELKRRGRRRGVTEDGPDPHPLPGDGGQRGLLLLAEQARRQPGRHQGDVPGPEPGAVEHRGHAAIEVLRGPRRVLERAEARAEDRGERGPPARRGARGVLQEEEGGALTEWVRCLTAVVGDPFETGALDGELLGRTGEQRRGVPAAQQPGGVVEGEQPGGRAAGDGDVGALEAVPDRALSARAVHDGVGEPGGVDEVGLLAGERVPREIHDRLHAAGRAEHETGGLRRRLEPLPVLLEQIAHGGDRDPGGPVHGTRALAAEHGPDVEAGDEPGLLVGDRPPPGVERGDRAAARGEALAEPALPRP